MHPLDSPLKSPASSHALSPLRFKTSVLLVVELEFVIFLRPLHPPSNTASRTTPIESWPTPRIIPRHPDRPVNGFREVRQRNRRLAARAPVGSALLRACSFWTGIGQRRSSLRGTPSCNARALNTEARWLFWLNCMQDVRSSL
uniref:Uncharacterized protein n=1 Tax=Mycena chlorophos TaxID=658473 RepID=A0ABQ0LVW3_MYCCL|nr:predicted protein [Mycena chlorophos]